MGEQDTERVRDPYKYDVLRLVDDLASGKNSVSNQHILRVPLRPDNWAIDPFNVRFSQDPTYMGLEVMDFKVMDLAKIAQDYIKRCLDLEDKSDTLLSEYLLLKHESLLLRDKVKEQAWKLSRLAGAFDD